MYNLLQLNSMKLAELKAIAEELKIESSEKLKKQELIFKVIDAQRVIEQSESGADVSNSETVSVTQDIPAPKQRRERVKKNTETKSSDETSMSPSLLIRLLRSLQNLRL